VGDPVRFTIEGEPVPKERPRKGQHGNFYTPRATKQYEELIAQHWMAARGRMFEGAVRLSVWIYTANPKIDGDNVIKAVADGLNKKAFKDDRQICEWYSKIITSRKPRVVVEVTGAEREEEPA
jgi:Holliday junction resolvase RusA-like endonuclease